jgi:hypothetical protein
MFPAHMCNASLRARHVANRTPRLCLVAVGSRRGVAINEATKCRGALERSKGSQREANKPEKSAALIQAGGLNQTKMPEAPQPRAYHFPIRR